MWLFFILIVFILLFVVSAALTLVGKVLGGVFSLFGLKSSFHGYSSNGRSSESTNGDSPQLVRSELGAKRMKQFKELAQETEFVEETDDKQ